MFFSRSAFFPAWISGPSSHRPSQSEGLEKQGRTQAFLYRKAELVHTYVSIFSDIFKSPLGSRFPGRGGPRKGRRMASDLRAMVDQLKAVSHPLRLRVLTLLDAGELCVCQVAEALQVPQSSVSEALRELRRVGFVNERKEGRWVFVSVVPPERASPLLQGILAEAMPLTEVQSDRDRAVEVKTLSIPAVCCKVQQSAKMEASHV